MYGVERREQIKRRVNESRVLKQVEAMENGAMPATHSRAEEPQRLITGSQTQKPDKVTSY